jgi:hypothetical protein
MATGAEMPETETLLDALIARRRGGPETWDGLNLVERARMLAYVDQARLPRVRRNRAEELAFWLSLGPDGARHWLASRVAGSQDYLGWLPPDALGEQPQVIDLNALESHRQRPGRRHSDAHTGPLTT